MHPTAEGRAGHLFSLVFSERIVGKIGRSHHMSKIPHEIHPAGTWSLAGRKTVPTPAA